MRLRRSIQSALSAGCEIAPEAGGAVETPDFSGETSNYRVMREIPPEADGAVETPFEQLVEVIPRP